MTTATPKKSRKKVPTKKGNAYSVSSILEVNRQLGVPSMLWGRSGTGKSSHLVQYAQDNNMDIILVEGIAIQPSLSAIPKITEDHVRILLTDWLHKACIANKPTLLFIDEFNRVESNMAFNLLTNVLLARQYQGHSLSEHVQIVAACNYEEEDNGVRELPDALYKRLMHLEWAPDLSSVIKYMPIPTEYKEALASSEACIDMAPVPFFKQSVITKLNNNPRQTSRAVNYFILGKQKGLSESQLFEGVQGLIGEAVHIIMPLISQVNEKIPEFEDENFFNICEEWYAKGKGQELIQTFKLRAERDREETATYVLMLNIPEIISAMTTDFLDLKLPLILIRNSSMYYIDVNLKDKDSMKRMPYDEGKLSKFKYSKNDLLLYPAFVTFINQLRFDEKEGKMII